MNDSHLRDAGLAGVAIELSPACDWPLFSFKILFCWFNGCWFDVEGSTLTSGLTLTTVGVGGVSGSSFFFLVTSNSCRRSDEGVEIGIVRWCWKQWNSYSNGFCKMEKIRFWNVVFLISSFFWSATCKNYNLSEFKSAEFARVFQAFPCFRPGLKLSHTFFLTCEFAVGQDRHPD